uniref:Uncharacterized protein n=1 Tax=Clytia hemisphaerica TaxID=252671 RepID=A0A7M5WI98_9CNID
MTVLNSYAKATKNLTFDHIKTNRAKDKTWVLEGVFPSRHVCPPETTYEALVYEDIVRFIGSDDILSIHVSNSKRITIYIRDKKSFEKLLQKGLRYKSKQGRWEFLRFQPKNTGGASWTLTFLQVPRNYQATDLLNYCQKFGLVRTIYRKRLSSGVHEFFGAN